jgi:hypothetical protein
MKPFSVSMNDLYSPIRESLQPMTLLQTKRRLQQELVLSNSFIQPVTRFWTLLENLYPERSTARILEFRDFQMKPAESMANMVSRLQTLKLVLKQPELHRCSSFWMPFGLSQWLIK